MVPMVGPLGCQYAQRFCVLFCFVFKPSSGSQRPPGPSWLCWEWHLRNYVVLQIQLEKASLCLSLPWFPAWPSGNASVSSLPSAYRLCCWPTSALASPSDLPASALPCHQTGSSLATLPASLSYRLGKAFWLLESLDPAGSLRDFQK